MVWCDVMWCDVMWCDVMWCGVGGVDGVRVELDNERHVMSHYSLTVLIRAL